MRKDQDQFIGNPKKPRQITRRGFLIGAAGATLTGLVLLGGYEHLINQQTSNFNPDTSNLSENLKQFESQMADKPITFEQAKMLVPTVVKLYVDSTATSKSLEQIVQETFIVQKDLKQLYLDYPNVEFSKEVEQAIETSEKTYPRDRSSGFSTKERIFLFLEEINTETPSLQYDEFSKAVNCAKSTPTVKFRSGVLQEIVTYNCTPSELDNDILKSYQRVNNFFQGTNQTFIKGNLFGFWATVSDNNGVKPEGGLAKITADYIATNISLSYGLPYTARTKPIDLVNFESVLVQSEITINDLLLLHKESNLKDFMLKIANGAQKTSFQSDEQKLDFTTRLFLFNSYRAKWQEFRAYFPKVDINHYEYRPYNEYPHLPDIIPGCKNL